MPLRLGESAADFELTDTAGATHRLAEGGSAATVVYWTCNHCPYALAWQDRMHALAADYSGRGVRVLAINSNDAESHPGDSPEAMAARVAEEVWNHPFLHDPDQSVAAAWGAEVTPHVFILDADLTLRYRGAPDSDYDDESRRAEWAREALEAVLAGAEVGRPETEAVGCSLKWKP